MSTYAIYRLWAGILVDDLDVLHNPFFDQVLEEIDGVERDGLTFTSVTMHGRMVGIGVVVQELDWTTEIGNENLYGDPASLAERAGETLRRVKEVLSTLELDTMTVDGARLYHHIDLGG